MVLLLTNVVHLGYWVSTVLVEYIGRKPIQIGGFLFEALFCECISCASECPQLTFTVVAILAGKFHTLSTASFIACFALLQVSCRFSSLFRLLKIGR